MNNLPNYTGLAPAAAFSQGNALLGSPISNPAPLTKTELIDFWFIDPLRKMNGHQAFVCLSACFFLYEKYLRKTGQIEIGKKFNKGNKVFNLIGKDLGVSAEDAFEFWTCWRNGLAHSGMPNRSKKYQWGMTGSQTQTVVISSGAFIINPWLIRDKILNRVASKKQIWDDELAPLMKAFTVTEP